MASPAAVLNILVTANTGAAQASLAKMNTELKGTEARAGSASAAAGKFGKVAKVGLAAVAVAAAATAKELYDVGKEFDDAYDKIRTGTGKTGKQLERLKKDFRNVVSSVPTSFDDAATAITEVNKRLDVSHKQGRVLSKQFLELSRITESDLRGNIKGVARAFEDWDVPLRKQSDQLDIFFRAAQKSGITVEELTTLLAKFGSPLRVVGFSVDEATAMFASFEKAGVNIQTMLPGLKMALKNFLKEDRDPKQALQKTFEGIEDGTIKSSKALEIFGQRAGADMVEAVNQGRFHLAGFQKQIEGGNDTIRKAGKETMDASENFQLLGNKLKVLLEPAATAVYKAVGNLAGALARVDVNSIKQKIASVVQSLKDFWKESGAVRAAVALMVSIAKKVLSSLVQFMQGWAQIIRGVVKVVSGILTGNFGRAWDGVKDIFRGAIKALIGMLGAVTAPFRTIAARAGEAMGSAFSSAWDFIEGLFEGGVNKVIGFLNTLIDAINVIPGIPDIGHIGTLGGGGGEASTGKPGGKNGGGNLGKTRSGAGHARGGPIFGGSPTGDSIPAMLERGEYVLNRKAVQAMGKRQLDAINFGVAPRFALGGLSDLAGKAVGAVSGAANKGAGYFIDKLPKPNLPAPFSGIGPYVIGQVTDYIKNGFKSKKLGKFTSALGGPGGAAPPGFEALFKNWDPSHPQWDVWQTGLLLQKMGFEVAENPHFGGVHPVHTAGSYHYSGRAIDFNWPGGGGVELSHLQGVYGALSKLRPKDPLIEDAGGSNQHGHFAFQKGGIVGRGINFLSKGGVPSWVHGTATLNADQLASLAAFVGMPHPALMGQIAMGESSGIPTNVGHDAGGTEGLGLWQITTGYNDSLIAKYGGRSAMFDPLTNAKAAAELLASSGPGAWYAPPTGPKGHIFPLGATGKGRSGKAAATVKPVAGLGKGRSFAKHANIRQHNKAVHRNKQGIGRGHTAIPPAEVEPAEVVGGGEVDEAAQRQLEATEALTAAIEDHKRTEDELKAELKRQTDFANEATATNSAVAWKALSDILSGNLGARSFHQAQTAGNGSVGSY